MSRLRAALEDALAANPDDLATHMAYADFLVEQGDPHGELIQVQLALEDDNLSSQRSEDLRLRELELLDTHERTWLGDLADHIIEKEVHEYYRERGLVNHRTWHRGWLDEVYLRSVSLEATRALAKCPAARLLTRLDLGEGGYAEPHEIRPEDGAPFREGYAALYPLLKAPFLEHVRFFRRGEKVDFTEEYHNCTTGGDGVVELVARMPRLEELQSLVLGVGMDRLFALPLAKLRTLVVYHERDVYPLEVLAGNPAFAALETLRLHPAHSYGGEGYLPLGAISPLVSSPHLSSLKHLHVYASSMGDEGCAEIVRSGILRRLETLDLEHGCVTDAGARILANTPDIRHLHTLSLEHNQLSDDGVTLLQGLGIPEVRLGRQLAVGDDEYLMTGDME